MWVTFGKREKTRLIPIHEVVLAIGPEKTRGILFYHAFTFCDVVCAFHGKTKKSVWYTWDVCDEVLSTFAKLIQCPSVVEDSDLQGSGEICGANV